MTVISDFLKEYKEAGSVKQETVERLAEHLRNKPKTGAPKKVRRDLEACTWYLIATDRERYKSNVAFSQLAMRLKTDDRNARRIEKKGRSVDHLSVVFPSVEGGYVALILLADIRKMPSVTASYDGRQYTTFQQQRFCEGKSAYFFFFGKSDF